MASSPQYQVPQAPAIPSSPHTLCYDPIMKRLTGPTAALLGLIVLAGCGIKGPPLPPEIRVADPTRDLTVFQENQQAILSWSYPSSTTSGESLHDLESVELWRATLLEVEAPVPGESARDRNLNRQLLVSNGERIAVLDQAGLDAATRGSKLEWYDNLEVWRRDNPADEPQMIWYAVRSVCCRGRESGLSNIARIVPTVPPAPPTELVLEAEAEGIRLSWVPYEEVPVIVERSSDAELWNAVTGKPLSTGEWLDRSAGQGQGWNYRLRSVRRIENGPRVIGEPSTPVGLFYPDVYPPTAPTDLVCLPEGERVRLRWRSVATADSYRVSRGAEGSTPKLLTAEIKAVQFEDDAPPPGTSIYSVTAVDLAGNESEASTCIAARGSNP
jgi:predicted small lipoprotein YifL